MEKTKKKFLPSQKFLAFEAFLLQAPLAFDHFYDVHPLFGWHIAYKAFEFSHTY